MAKQLPMIDVDANGVTAEGDETTWAAVPHMVENGHMVNTPVLCRYPDGAVRKGTLVGITAKGMEFFAREMPVGLRKAGGNA